MAMNTIAATTRGLQMARKIHEPFHKTREPVQMIAFELLYFEVCRSDFEVGRI